MPKSALSCEDAGGPALVRFVGKSLPLMFLCVSTFFTSAFFAPIAWAAKPPEPDQIIKTLTAYFATLPDYQAGDLLCQSQVAGAVDSLAKIGWQVEQKKEITELALADGSLLVRQLATPRGKSFMRKIAKVPGTYSRLDRLSRISNGQSAVKQLIKDPGGDTMLIYMATTPGGKNLGSMMAGTPQGSNLNQPTGRLYTADDLLALIRQAYAQTFTSP